MAKQSFVYLHLRSATFGLAATTTNDIVAFDVDDYEDMGSRSRFGSIPLLVEKARNAQHTTKYKPTTKAGSKQTEGQAGGQPRAEEGRAISDGLLLLDLTDAPSGRRRPELRRGGRPPKATYDEQWAAHKSSGKLMVIDFSASWCGPCRFIEPAFKELASRFTDAIFVKIDVDELAEVARTWKVEAMPTFVLVKDGKERRPPPPPLTSQRWAPLVPSHPRASPPPALRLRAPASPLRASVPRDSCAGATVPRAPCAAAALGGGVKAEATERKAPDWDVLKRVALLALGCCAAAAALGCGAARAAAEDSIKASGFGLRVAESLRRLGWPEDAVVFALATLPVIELRGAIPVGYWLRLHPVRLTILSVLGVLTEKEHGACTIYHPLPEKTCEISVSEKRVCNPNYGPPL
ncbi:unnamed protein product [Miscanthus lutarioriparius]|uniref:Thioredoxin domain-containing protein n=1 Tax=Miscanthus lutarioriparius TaxID=422564 RepID=A0A811MHC6_9POAL|nr:unnamed protein product [Miscanthus lutarioriparius]